MTYLAAGLVCLLATRAAADGSHAPMRPLPVASNRPLAAGPTYYVDAKAGDKGDGSKQKPWKSIDAAAKRLKPGDTLVLRGGTYFEWVTLQLLGTEKAPITIRSAPGELAILDGGLREFEDTPKTAWEPDPDGVAGEFRSVHMFPELQEGPGKERGVWMLGNFVDSMVPLHGYRYVEDLRSDNELWTVPNSQPGTGIYVGPGAWFDWKTHRIHVRLAHTTLPHQENYTGETDPRKLALVLGADHSPLTIHQAAHVRLQDLVIRGSATRTVEITSSTDIELDGLTIYGGTPALWVGSSDHLRVVRSALRGDAAPWSSRASMKYRGASPYLFVADNKRSLNHDWELAYNEFTDGHDGLVLDSIKVLRFHHNRVDNFNDDGIYLTLPPRKNVPEDVQIYENLVTRVYTTLAFAETERGHGGPPNSIGTGVYIYRNVFDLRQPTYGWIPKDAAMAASMDGAMSPSRMCGDHGSPVWEPLWFYQNTVIAAGPAFRDYYGEMMVMGTRNTQRRLFNNVFLQIDGTPGLNVPGVTDDLQGDGNLLWGLRAGPSIQGDFFAGKKPGPPGFGEHDVFADPQLVHVVDNDPALDVRPAGGGVVDAGVTLPDTWPDSLRTVDKGKPDIGALPLGAAMLRVGPAAAPAR